MGPLELRHPAVLPVNDHVWLMNDSNEATFYVIAGTKRAVVIDSSTGLCNVREEAERLTDLPLTLVNTHGHFDHIGGNWSFGSAFMNRADDAVARDSLSLPDVLATAKALGVTFPEFSHIGGGDVLDLGGLSLEVYELPGHTPGEIVLLDREDRLLFSGDGIIEQLWLQLPESLPVHVQVKSMRRLLPLRPAFDFVLSGHSRAPQDAELFDALLSAAESLSSGDTAGDETFSWFGGTCRAHPYGASPRRICY